MSFRNRFDIFANNPGSIFGDTGDTKDSSDDTSTVGNSVPGGDPQGQKGEKEKGLEKEISAKVFFFSLNG